MVTLFIAALAAPLAAVSDGDGSTFHRVNIEGLPMLDWETATHSTALCGEAVKLVEVDGELIQWRWLRTRGTKYRRCPSCNGKART